MEAEMKKALCGLFFTKTLESKLMPHLYFEILNLKKKNQSKAIFCS